MIQRKDSEENSFIKMGKDSTYFDGFENHLKGINSNEAVL